MPANALLLEDRVEIYGGIRAELNDVEIADRLDRHRTTINREINRNGGRDRYDPVKANTRAKRCRRRPKRTKLETDSRLAAHVSERLQDRDSPQRIAIELEQGHYPDIATISHETIYQSIQRNGTSPLGKGIHKQLHLGRRRRKPRNAQTSSNTNPVGIYCSIHDRPQAATDRTELGHLEGDLIVGAYNQSALITLFDRMTRYLWLAPVKAKTADAIHDALINLYTNRIPPQATRTLTWDQGSEIARHPELALTLGIDIYITDPKSPWQRPTNEAGNALIRRFTGKGTNLNHLTTNDLTWIEHRINTTPRPTTLNKHTAHHTYTQAVAMTG